MPGALQIDNRGDEDLTALSESVLREITPLLEQLKIMRAREGESLEAILHATLDRLAEATEGVATLRPEIEQRYQERLKQRLKRPPARSSTASGCSRKLLYWWSAAISPRN